VAVYHINIYLQFDKYRNSKGNYSERPGGPFSMPFSALPNCSRKCCCLLEKKERIHLSFPPEGGRAGCWGFPEPFQPHWREYSGLYGVDGCGRKVVGTAEVDTDPAFALSVIWDISSRCDGVGKPLKKNQHLVRRTGVKTRDLPNVKWGARRLATILGWFVYCWVHLFYRLQGMIRLERESFQWRGGVGDGRDHVLTR
jgi:hypothetical protein